MPAKKSKPSTDVNTEAKIKAAARAVFHKKGFAGARTRDIADAAGINLALLNYYFRSKEKLFQLIMLETISDFLKNMLVAFNDEQTSLEQKIALVAEEYIELFSREPELPLFLISEMRSHGAEILEKLPITNNILHSAFIRQYEAAAKKAKMIDPNPLHFIMNLMGMIIFPVIASPMIKKVGRLNDNQFNKLLQDRKKLIPVWVSALLKAK